jgi:hypothetical protein
MGYDGSPPAQQTPWGGMQWVLPGSWAMAGLALNSCLTVGRGWYNHKRLGGCHGHNNCLHGGRGGKGPSHRMISSRARESMDLATFICIWTFVTCIGPLWLAVRDLHLHLDSLSAFVDYVIICGLCDHYILTVMNISCLWWLYMPVMISVIYTNI